MTHRELPAAEWAALDDTGELGPFRQAIPPHARIIVVEDDHDTIIGTWAVVSFVHLDGVWIAPEHRKRGRVAWHLLEGMRSVADDLGCSVVLTGALTQDVAALIQKLGGLLIPGACYALPVRRVR